MENWRRVSYITRGANVRINSSLLYRARAVNYTLIAHRCESPLANIHLKDGRGGVRFSFKLFTCHFSIVVFEHPEILR
jgi:hypothetical protein